MPPERLWLGFTPRKRREKAAVVVMAARWPQVWCERRKDGRDGEKMAVMVAAAIAGREGTAEAMALAWENLLSTRAFRRPALDFGAVRSSAQ